MQILSLINMFLGLMEFACAHCLSSITKVILMQPSLMIQVALGSSGFSRSHGPSYCCIKLENTFGPNHRIGRVFGNKKGSLVCYGIKFVQC